MNKTGLTLSISLLLLCFAVPLRAEELRVSPDWLYANLDRSNIVILDARTHDDYDTGHIENALNLPHSLTYQQKANGSRIVEPDVIQTLLRERGIDNDKTIIVYDGGELLDASRIFWTLEVYGLKQVRILSPGLEAWISKGYPVVNTSPQAKPSQYVITVDHRRIASKFATQLATLSPAQIIVDARPEEAYQGKISSAKRHGHIPSAINIPVSHLIESRDGNAALKGQQELKSIYAGLPKNSKVILYCEIGRASSTTYLTLRELGYDVSNYDASWSEWGNDLSLPIEK